MSWRFRKTFKVLPGVKLNVTRHGLNATLGTAPFSVNVGPRGVYRNISIPGTGMWNRERIDGSSDERPSQFIVPPAPPGNPSLQIQPTPGREIRSASTELLNSQSLDDVRKVLREAYDEREALRKEIITAEGDADVAARRYQRWERGLIAKRVFKKSFGARKEIHETAQAKLDELREQLSLTTLETEIDIDRLQAEPYYQMRDDFAALSEAAKIWDTLERRAIDRIVERSAANEAIKREPVQFMLNSCDLIQWEQKVPHLPNRAGGDMYIYPGFMLYRASKQAFALIDFREVTLVLRSVRFIEDEPIPHDACVVGHAWAKSNKDGTPDRRFRDNYQIPIALYASLTFTSPSGLEEEFQISNPELAGRFARAWERFQSSFTSLTPGKVPPRSSIAPNSDSSGEEETNSDVATAFAQESETARSLAIEQGDHWEYLLTEELLRTKLIAIEKQFSDLGTAPLPTRSLRGPDYMTWLQGRVDELTPLTQQITEAAKDRLVASWGKPGEAGDPLQILKAVRRIAANCEALLRWEKDIRSITPPTKLKRVGASLYGTAATLFAEVRRLPEELGRAVKEAQAGPKKVHIQLTFNAPPQAAQFLAEMDQLAKHPEWLT